MTHNSTVTENTEETPGISSLIFEGDATTAHGEYRLTDVLARYKALTPSCGFNDTPRWIIRAINAEKMLKNSTWDGGMRLLETYLNMRSTGIDSYFLNLDTRSANFYRPILKSETQARTKQITSDLPTNPIFSGDNELDSPHLYAIRWIKEATHLPWERVAQLVGVSRQALYLWLQGKTITSEHSRRILAVRDVLERATALHATPERLAAWLDTPRGTDARTAAELLAAGEFDKARYLAISKPSPKVARPSTWLKRPIPEVFRDSLEQREETLPPDRDHELYSEFGEPGSEER